MILIDKPSNFECIDALDTMYPTHVRYLSNNTGARVWYGGDYVDRTDTTYGYVLRGAVNLQGDNIGLPKWGITPTLIEGDYFVIPGRWEMSAINALNDKKKGAIEIWTCTRKGFRAPFQMGTVERKGRLSYIDGCSDSVLASMPRMGDPVLNYLHFPAGIRQTQHTHPSIRMGVVIRGKGVAFQDAGNGRAGWEKPLNTGSIFMLEEQELHSFRTDGCIMDIVAYHPDSDTGPTDENHAMLNRTHIGR